MLLFRSVSMSPGKLIFILFLSLVFMLYYTYPSEGCEPSYMDDDRPQYLVPSDYITNFPPLPLPRPKNLQNNN